MFYINMLYIRSFMISVPQVNMFTLVALIMCSALCTCVQGYGPHLLNDLGCWMDSAVRAVPTLEGHDAILDGQYTARSNAIQKCAEAAAKRNYEVICVQNGGWCASSASARETFWKKGKSTACAGNGKGGPWANHCYEINTIWIPKFSPIGCYKDTADRAIPTLEGTSAQLNGPYNTRTDAVRKCARLAASRFEFRHGTTFFAIQNGGWCAADTWPLAYDKYGESHACPDNGKGGGWANMVYKITSLSKFQIKTLGCFLDKKTRAINTAENANLELTGNYAHREDAIGKCARHAKAMGFKVFAVQNGGWCATAANAHLTYGRYGTSNQCSDSGKGGPWANQVYKII